MNKSFMFLAAISAAGITSIAAAHHHHHLTISTPTGTPGEQIQIVAGYLREEADLSISSTGLLMDGSEPFVLELPALHDDGPLAGQYTGTGLSLTSDFFARSGLLDGGDFYYQIAEVEPIRAEFAALTWAWIDEITGELIPEASSVAPDLLGQSLHVGIDEHPHDQVVGLTSSGDYYVELKVWDANGVYLDSDPVIIKVHAELNPADLDANGEVDGDDLALLLGAWGPCVQDHIDCMGDINGDHVVNGIDLALLLGSWG